MAAQKITVDKMLKIGVLTFYGGIDPCIKG
jgi:hypothetical protein